MAGLIEVRPGERSKTFLMFVYFFFVIAIVYILKPVRSALFLESLGAHNLRYVYVGEGVFLIFVVAAYIQFAKRVSHRVFYPAVLAFFASHLIVFWFLFHMQVPYLAAFFYIWVASFSIAMTTQFWTLANDIFNSMEAKRLFGLIASGGSLGGVAGGLITSVAVRWVKTEDLLLVAAGVVAVCIAVVILLQKELAAAPGRSAAQPAHNAKHDEESRRPVWKLFTSSSYLLMLTGLVMIAKMSSAIVENQFSRMVEISIVSTEARTAFFGGFMAWLNTISWLMQLVFTGLFLRFLGVGLSLWILPVGLLFTAGASLAFPVLAAAVAMKAFDGSVNYSIQQASKEMLFLPLSSALRYRVKPVIDMLGFRAAKSLAGLYILAAAPLLGIHDEHLGVLVLILVPFWLFMVWRMRKGYSQLLRQHVLAADKLPAAAASETPPREIFALLDHQKTPHGKEYFTHSAPFVRKFAAAAVWAHSQDAGQSERLRQRLAQLAEEEILLVENPFSSGALSREEIHLLEQHVLNQSAPAARANEIQESRMVRLERDWNRLAGLLQDPHRGPADKRRILGLLGQVRSPKVAEFLLKELHGVRNSFIRASLIESLDMVHKNGALINRFRLREEVRYESELCADFAKLTFFAQSHGKSLPHSEAAAVLFSALGQEALQRCFGLLSLLYPPDEMRMMYALLVRHSAQDAVHAHVLELLNSMLEPDFFIPVQAALDRRTENASSRQIKAIAGKFSQSSDPWFLMTGQWVKEMASWAEN